MTNRKKARAKKVAAFDVDGSLMREALLVLLKTECFDLHLMNKVVEKLFDELRLAHRDRKISFDAYDKQLVRLFSHRIKGKFRSDLEVAARQVYDKYRDWLYIFTRALLEELKGTHQCIAITGAMKETVDLLAPYWGFDQHYCTELEVDGDGRYTGRDQALPVADKGAALRAHVAAHGATFEGSVALGDTDSDVSMLAAVDHPIAFNANPGLRLEAVKNGWPIVVERRDGIYVLWKEKYRIFDAANAKDAVRHVLSLKR